MDKYEIHLSKEPEVKTIGTIGRYADGEIKYYYYNDSLNRPDMNNEIRQAYLSSRLREAAIAETKALNLELDAINNTQPRVDYIMSDEQIKYARMFYDIVPNHVDSRCKKQQNSWFYKIRPDLDPLLKRESLQNRLKRFMC